MVQDVFTGHNLSLQLFYINVFVVLFSRWHIWSARVITSQSKTTKWCNCTHLQSWTTSPSGCSTTNLSSPPKTTSALAQTSNQSGTLWKWINASSWRWMMKYQWGLIVNDSLTCVFHPVISSVTGWWRLRPSTMKWVTSRNVKLKDSWSESLPN